VWSSVIIDVVAKRDCDDPWPPVPGQHPGVRGRPTPAGRLRGPTRISHQDREKGRSRSQAVRTVLWQDWFTDRETKRETGAGWRRELIGPLAPPAETPADLPRGLP